MSSGSLDLRLYQELIFEHAKIDNTIAFLPTGTGKTLIACYLIGHRIQNIRRDRERSVDWKKVAVFVAPTKTLLNQQVEYICKQCPEGVKAVILNGDRQHEGLEIDFWDRAQWQYYFNHYEVLGLTPEVLCKLLERTILPGDAIDLLVLDECHHVISGKHPMARLCESIHSKGYQPLILGLTASPLTTKSTKILEAYADIQNKMSAKIFVPSPDMLRSLQDHVSEAKIVVQEYMALEDKDEVAFTVLLRFAVHLQEVIIVAKTNPNSVWYHLVRENLPEEYLPTLDDSYEYPLVCVRKLADVMKSFSQVETVLNDSGPYCGLLALLVMLKNDQFSLLYDMHSVSLSDLCKKTLSLDRDVILAQCKSLSLFCQSVRSVDDCDFLRRQRVCIFQVLLQLIKRVLNRLLVHEQDGRLQVLTESFLAKPDNLAHEGSLGIWFIRRIVEKRPALSKEDKHTIELERNSNFIPHLHAYLSYILEHVDIRPLSACLADLSTDCVSGCQLVSNKMLKLLQLLLRFFGGSKDAMADLPTISAPPAEASSPSLFCSPPSSPLSSAAPSPSTITVSEQSTSASLPSSAIVFCKMRLTVQVFEMLTHRLAAASAPHFPLKPACITGSDNEADQNNTLRSLKDHEVNVLFATDVVEEGVDVKSCNLVVNYDGPATAKSYIQRKGRARVLNAHIVHILSKPYEEQKDYEDIIKFIVQERHAKEEIHKCLELLNTPSPDTEKYLVPGTNASVDGTAAFSIIHEHCIKLKEKTSIEVHPQYRYDRLETVWEDGTKSTLFQCDLHLPIFSNDFSSAIDAVEFKSEYRNSKSKARSQSCLKAVEYLHTVAGVLDDHLRLIRPVEEILHQRTVPFSVPNSNEDDTDATDVFIKQVPDCMRNRVGRGYSSWAGTKMYLYKLEVQTVGNALEGLSFQTRQCINAMQQVGIALLEPLCDDVLEYNNIIFPHSNTNMSYRYVPYKSHAFELTREEVHAMMQFHRAVMCLQTDHTHAEDFEGFAALQASTERDPSMYDNLLGSWNSGTNTAFYIVFPVKPDDLDSTSINVDYVHTCAQQAHVLVHNLFVLTHNNAGQASAKDFQPAHRLSDCAESDMLVTSEGKNLFTTSSMLNSTAAKVKLLTRGPFGTSYANYFSQRNSHFEEVIRNRLGDPNHFLTPVLALSGKLTLIDIFELHNTATEQDSEVQVGLVSNCEQVQYVIPELSQVLGPSLFYFMSLVLPSVMHRLCTLLVAKDCRDTIGKRHDGDRTVIESMPLALVLQAITPKRALEMMSYERLEFYGDTVLKLLSTVDVFFCCPNGDQGKLTELRSRQVSNQKLSSIARNSDLGQYVRAVMLSSGNDRVLMSAPGVRSVVNYSHGLSPQPSLRNIRIRNPASLAITTEYSSFRTNVAHKMLADVVEALIGALYTHSGSLQEVMEFMKAFGIVYYTSSTLKEPRISELLEDALDTASEGYQPLLADWQVGELQDILGYTFNHPVFLNMAVTRMSKSLTHNYERLELLGDAVLDLLVVETLMPQVEDLPNEGALTAAKSSKVNNEVLANHVMRLELGRFIQHEGEMSIYRAFSPDASNEENGGSGGGKALSDVLEALLGAVYLDSGLDINAARSVAARLQLLD